MNRSMELSPQLDAYARALQDWAVECGRPHAREADRRHAPPVGRREILDTCPVPLGRSDKGATDAVPEFPDGHWITSLVLHEYLNYGDTWMFGTLGNGIGHLVVEAMGTPAQIEKWYEPVIRDRTCTAFGLTEPQFGSDTSMVATTARQEGDQWVLNGTKLFCSLGASAEYTTVFATVDPAAGPAAIRAFVVPKGTPGFVVLRENEEKLGMRSWQTSQIGLVDCAIPLENQLGHGGPGEQPPQRTGRGGALEALGLNRPNMAAIAVGLARAALDVTRAELAGRRAGFSVQRWALVDNDLRNMSDAVERGKRMMYRCQELVVHDRADRTLSAMGKAFAPETCERVIRRCMQLLGPDGASEDLLLEKWWRDCKILDVFEGAGQIQRIIIGRGLMGRAVG